jgi:hypothetical protein
VIDCLLALALDLVTEKGARRAAAGKNPGPSQKAMAQRGSATDAGLCVHPVGAQQTTWLQDAVGFSWSGTAYPVWIKRRE